MMRKLLSLVVLPLVFAAAAPVASATEKCSASVVLRDFKEGFTSKVAAFDFCFSRVQQFELDQSPGWKARYCKLVTYTENYKELFNMTFSHTDSTYKDAEFTESIFYAVADDYASKIGNGSQVNLELKFSKDCKSYQD